MTKPKDANHQLGLQLGGSDFPAPVRQTARANKARHRLPVLQPELVPDRGFSPKQGVPRTRADCPKGGVCEMVRCRHHLFLETAEHRAGRPGLSSVPRGPKGLTASVKGKAGDARPGTTLRPAWLKVRGLEIEREVHVMAWRDDDGNLELLESRAGSMDYWLARLHPGEPVLVFDDDTHEVVARCTLTQDKRIKFDREITATFLVLTRVREVSSCALDLIDRYGKLSNEQCGDALGRHRTLIARETKRALRKAMVIAAQMGMTEADLLRGLRELGAEKA